jgi:hypothetical protein
MNKTQIASELGFHRNTIHKYINILNLPKHHMMQEISGNIKLRLFEFQLIYSSIKRFKLR